jgi:hypothetical protein
LPAHKKTAAAKQFPDKASIYGMLKHYARQHGKSDGWSSNSFREIYGVWPNYYRHAPLQMPSPELLSWIQAKNIRWAKSPKNPANRHKLVLEDA